MQEELFNIEQPKTDNYKSNSELICELYGFGAGEGYDIIYADPPWNGLGWNNGSGLKCPARHYSVMTDSDILTLPVEQIAKNNAALFLWVTFPNLPLGIKTIEAWGFRYATVAFTWVKKNKKSDSWFWGCGNYTRANAEICLLGMRGSMKRKSASVHSVIDDRIMEHSKKPDTARQRIVELFGNLRKIELFARDKMDGWDVWGNQAPNSV